MLRQLSIVSVAILGAASLSLGGCAETQFNGFSNAPMAQSAVFQHPDFNNGQVPPEAMQQIRRLSAECQRQARPQIAGLMQSAITGGAAGAATNGLINHTDAGILGYVAKSTKLVTREGLVGGAISGGYGNAVNGAVGAASTIGSCHRDMWAISKAYHPTTPGARDFTSVKYKGTIVEAVTAGKGLNPSYVPNAGQ